MNDLMTKSFLSYVELKKQARNDKTDIEKGIQEQKESHSDLSKFFQEAESIKSDMKEIKNLLFDLQALNEETKSTHSPKLLRGLRDRMESNMVSVLRKANVVRARLESLDNSNKSKEGSAIQRTMLSVTNGFRAKLKEMMNDFQDLRNKIVSDHKDYLKRKYYNETGKYPSEETIEKVLNGGLIMDDNQERHEAVMDLQRSLNKLHQVFLDMAVLVEDQGRDLDDIELNVAKAGSFVSGGTDSLFYAKQIKDQKNKNWVCLVWGLVVIIVLVCWIAVLSSF